MASARRPMAGSLLPMTVGAAAGIDPVMTAPSAATPPPTDGATVRDASPTSRSTVDHGVPPPPTSAVMPPAGSLALLSALLEKQQADETRLNAAGAQPCLFCRTALPTVTALFDHMFVVHAFHIGRLANLIHVDVLLAHLRATLAAQRCLYCERTFRDAPTLRLHMRKKKHFRFHPKHDLYDRFYMVNYLPEQIARTLKLPVGVAVDLAPLLHDPALRVQHDPQTGLVRPAAREASGAASSSADEPGDEHGEDHDDADDADDAEGDGATRADDDDDPAAWASEDDPEKQWSGWDEPATGAGCPCVLGDAVLPSAEAALAHAAAAHGLDLVGLRRVRGWDTFDCIKVVNHVRAHTLRGTCFVCGAAVDGAAIAPPASSSSASATVAVADADVTPAMEYHHSWPMRESSAATGEAAPSSSSSLSAPPGAPPTEPAVLGRAALVAHLQQHDIPNEWPTPAPSSAPPATSAAAATASASAPLAASAPPPTSLGGLPVWSDWVWLFPTLDGDPLLMCGSLMEDAPPAPDAAVANETPSATAAAASPAPSADEGWQTIAPKPRGRHGKPAPAADAAAAAASRVPAARGASDPPATPLATRWAAVSHDDDGASPRPGGAAPVTRAAPAAPRGMNGDACPAVAEGASTDARRALEARALALRRSSPPA
ncbi:hypothetical protein CXG81DRAFT_18437 [Caulochytrium protostelioides]|uniref:C2H2-type domain-containing protein n=1 Tax=Caulochytrium protostelioides TaxID=1555241 RepID=A0A4P9X936_9FUNG|nr:hypothetical protein CXG81DRAFT_18437 [Caulochytrium protostelioides]|eukprot:RKP01806.1 hypothetical protein CXG81DRAFT_18437 [Caulochytrium protostelioides]